MRGATILDEHEEVRRIDKSDMLGLCMKAPKYCEDAIQRAKKVKIPTHVYLSEKASIKYGKPRHVIIAGMGGSAIGGEILQDWLRDEFPLPIEVCKDYTLPAYANEKTLVFAVSYSGNTEETLSAFLAAVKRKCMTVSITSGGHLLNFSEKLQIPHVKIPSGLPPRVAIPYVLLPLPILIERMGIPINIEKEIKEAIQVLKKVSEENAPQTSTEKNSAKKLALELVETIPVVYGFRQYRAIARRLKTQFNENSKVPSKHDFFPELSHNEVVGWEAPEALTKRFSIILIRDGAEPLEIRQRIEITKSLALHKARKVSEIYAVGEGKLAKMLSVVHIGDLASIYLAILRNTDPTPIKTTREIRRQMEEKFNTIKRLKEEIQKIAKGVVTDE